MNLEIESTLLNTYLPTLIVTILMTLREQLKENDQFNVSRLQAQHQKSLLSMTKS